MCGIAGFSRATPSSIEDGRRFARMLALAIESRGHDATGFGWAEDGWPWYWSEAGKATRVMMDAPLPVGMRETIVHTRAATKGSPKVPGNNHPLTAPGIVLVHNGRCSNDDELFALLGCERAAEVDSEAIAALLSYGPEVLGSSHPVELLGLLEGSAALAWLDGGDPGTVHLARTSGRPLSVGWTRKGDLVFASTAEALRDVEQWSHTRITRVRSIPEGTYVRAAAGEIVEQRKFPVARPTRAATFAPAVRQPVAVSKGQAVIDGIDWNNLAPRRGWK